MTEQFLLYILLIHFLGDFCLQTDWQAKNKSTDVWALTAHCLVYSLVWVIALLPVLGITAVIFGIMTFATHLLTDFFTSRISKPFWDKGDTHTGFIIVGFDQILHYIQLYLTFKLLL